MTVYIQSNGFLIFYKSDVSLGNSKINEHFRCFLFSLIYNSAVYILMHIFLYICGILGERFLVLNLLGQKICIAMFSVVFLSPKMSYSYHIQQCQINSVR